MNGSPAHAGACLPIGMFDSGVGGLSVLKQAQKILPSEDYIFLGDNLNAPYGQRDEGEIIRLTCSAVDILVQKRVKALVIACNTATSAAASTLRANLSIPVIGMEPALKPAQAHRHGGRILVLATPATLSLPKFGALMERYGDGAVPVPITGLVERIERGEVSGAPLEEYLTELLAPYLNYPVDAAVLGCTHYIFAKKAIAHVLGPNVVLVDGNEGTAKQLKRVLSEGNLLAGGHLGEQRKGRVTLMTTGDEAVYLPLMERLLGMV